MKCEWCGREGGLQMIDGVKQMVLMQEINMSHVRDVPNRQKVCMYPASGQGKTESCFVKLTARKEATRLEIDKRNADALRLVQERKVEESEQAEMKGDGA